MTTTAQEDFDKIYITSGEIQKELSVHRSVVLQARRRGMLPEPIRVGGAHQFVWERKTVRPFLEAWKLSLASQRGQLK